MRKISSFFVLCLVGFLTLLMSGFSAFSQEASLRLSMRRDFGYSSGTGRIQGLFTLSASGPENLVKVVFLMDGEAMGEDTEPPFKIQFDTGQYSLGEHIMSARGDTDAGGKLDSNEIHATFTPADEGMKAAGAIALPILGLVVGILIITSVSTMVSSRRKGSLPLGSPRNYGLSGGTICPKCGRPFALHFIKLNMFVGALDVCPHCGKWSLVRSQPIEILRQAEANELEWGKNSELVKGMTEEEKLRKDLDDSRYQGG